MRSLRRTLPLALLPTLAVGLVACDDTEAPDELRFESLEPAREPRPDPDPEPDPDPDPPWRDAYELTGKHIADLGFLPVVVEHMDPLPSPTTPYTDPAIAEYDRGWPIHALQWKDHATGNALQFDVADAVAAVAAFPYLGLYVKSIDAARINDIEEGNAPVTTQPFSQDPNGVWMETQIYDPAIGLAYAALVMHYWKSPVYLDATHNYLNDPVITDSFSHTIALELLEFTTGGATDILAACGFPSGASPSYALSNAPNCSSALILSDDLVSLWNDSLCFCSGWVPYVADVSLSPNELTTAWIGSLGWRGQMVFDPPADASEEDLAGLEILAEALADQIMIPDADGYLVRVRDLEPSEG